MNNLRLVLLGLAAGIALIFGVSLLIKMDHAKKPHPPQTTITSPKPAHPSRAAQLHAARQRIEAHIAAVAPAYMGFFTRLKQLMPHEYDVILDGFAKQSLNGVDVGNVDALLSQAVRELTVAKGTLAAKAGEPALSRIFTMQLAMMRALAAKSARLCVDFLYGRSSPAFFQFSSQNRRLVADMAVAGLEAIADGRSKNITRQPPSDKDFNLLEAALKGKGVSTAEIAAILDGKTPNPPIAEARMCAVGQTYLETLASLPTPVRLRIYGLAVQLMAHS